jgi:hypothetical protein
MGFLDGQVMFELRVGKALECGAVELGVQSGESCAGSIPGGGHEAGDGLMGERTDDRGSVPLLSRAFCECGIQIYLTCALRNGSEGRGMKRGTQTRCDTQK